MKNQTENPKENQAENPKKEQTLNPKKVWQEPELKLMDVNNGSYAGTDEARSYSTPTFSLS